MNITYPTDAPTNESIDKKSPLKWHAILWKNVNRNVRRLQTRIVKAMKAGKWHKVRSLQRLLVRSMSSKALAVHRVTENQGKRTAGVDGVTWNTPVQKEEAIQSLGVKPYRARPLRRIYIPKRNGKKRPLGIPTMQDRAEQALHLLALAPIAETTGDFHSYGFRMLRAAQDAIAQCFTILARRTSPQWILEADIAGCFDNIDHQWLMTHIPTDKIRLRQWLKAGYIHEKCLFPTEEGTPQGGIISPTLANMTLDGLQELIASHYPNKSQVALIRYADDFIITSNDKAILENEILPLVRSFLQHRGLTPSDEKTVITHIEQGFDFLGVNIRKYKRQLLTKPAKKSVQALLQKVRHIIKTEGRQLSARSLIQKLNPIIRGWAIYHRNQVSKQTFQHIDFHIHNALWRWAKRRHRNKSNSWINQRYFRPHAGFRPLFQEPYPTSDSSTPRKIFRAASLPIRRHIKVRQNVNPYDPVWEVYCEQRLFKRNKDAIAHKPLFIKLWHRQMATCPLCLQSLSYEENNGWEVHHVQHKVNGGTDDIHNLLLLHPNCHRQIHHPDFNGHLPRHNGVRDA